MSRIKRFVHFLHRNDGSLRSKTVRSGVWIGLSTVTIASLTLIKSIILARLLTPEIFGLMAICLIVIRGIQIFTETGFGAALIHRQTDIEKAKDVAFTLLVARGVLLFAITFMLAPYIAKYYENDIIDTIVKALSITLILIGLNNINVVIHQKELDFRRISYLNQVKMLIEFGVTVILAYYTRSIWALVIGYIVTNILGTILSYVFISGKPKFFYDKKIALELFHYGKYITGLTIVLFVTTEVDNLVIGKILGVEALGYYVIAYTLANLPATHIAKIISGIMMSVFSKIQHDNIAIQHVYLDILNLIAILTIPSAVGMAILAEDIIYVLYGEKWLPGVGALQILCIFGCLRAISTLNGYLYNAIGKPKIPFYLNSAKLLVILVIIYPLINLYGILGAALAVTAPIILQYFIAVFLFSKIIGLNLNQVLSVIGKYTIHSLIMAGVMLAFQQYFHQKNIIILLFLIVLGAATIGLLNRKYILLLIQKKLAFIETK